MKDFYLIVYKCCFVDKLLNLNLKSSQNIGNYITEKVNGCSS